MHLQSERGNACKVCFSSNPFISALLRYLLTCCFGSPIPSNFSASKILNFGGSAMGVLAYAPHVVETIIHPLGLAKG